MKNRRHQFSTPHIMTAVEQQRDELQQSVVNDAVVATTEASAKHSNDRPAPATTAAQPTNSCAPSRSGIVLDLCFKQKQKMLNIICCSTILFPNHLTLSAFLVVHYPQCYRLVSRSSPFPDLSVHNL